MMQQIEFQSDHYSSDNYDSDSDSFDCRSKSSQLEKNMRHITTLLEQTIARIAANRVVKPMDLVDDLLIILER